MTGCSTTDKPIRIYMIGDSTMANKDISKGNPERGWGHVLKGFFSENVTIENHAVNGRSTKSFIDEGRWDVVQERLRPGDYLIIQFGHNDEKQDEKRHTEPGSTFDANLERFVLEARERGAIPILMNSIVRRNFAENPNAIANDDYRRAMTEGGGIETDSLFDTHGAYLESPRNVALKHDVAFIDMNSITHKLVESMGREGSKQLFMWVEPGVCEACPEGRQDNTHLNIKGARVVAGLAVDAIAQAVPELKRYVCHYDYVVATDGSGDFFTFQELLDSLRNSCDEQYKRVRFLAGKYSGENLRTDERINCYIDLDSGVTVTGITIDSQP